MSLSLPALATHDEAHPRAVTAADFDAIVNRHQRKVYRVLLLMVRNPEDADNLTQECFLRAYQSMNAFRGECSVQTWLLRIAVNLARDHARNRKLAFWKQLLRLGDEDLPPSGQEPPSPQASAERGMIARQELDAVWQAVDRLSTRQKEVFILRFIEEMELKEIAEVLKIRTGTVKAQLFRAVTSVREQVRK